MADHDPTSAVKDSAQALQHALQHVHTCLLPSGKKATKISELDHDTAQTGRSRLLPPGALAAENDQ